MESWEGYFRAPVTGNYRFYLASDDYSEIYISNTSNSSNVSNLNKIAWSWATNYESAYYYDSQISNLTFLKAGEYYLFNAFRNQGYGASYMWVGVEIESKTWSSMSISAVQTIDIKTDALREIFDLKIFNYKQIKQFKIVLDQRNPATG